MILAQNNYYLRIFYLNCLLLKKIKIEENNEEVRNWVEEKITT